MAKKAAVAEVPEKVEETPEQEEQTLSNSAIAEAATNNSFLSSDQIELGGKVYKIVHLRYDDYILFLTLLAPLLEVAFSQMGLSTSAASLDALKIIQMCGSSLPELGRLVLRQTDPDITVEKVKELCPTPFRMAELVLMQVKHNDMIKDFSSFFPQLTTMMMTTM